MLFMFSSLSVYSRIPKFVTSLVIFPSTFGFLSERTGILQSHAFFLFRLFVQIVLQSAV